jgi:hypothetical protein
MLVTAQTACRGSSANNAILVMAGCLSSIARPKSKQGFVRAEKASMLSARLAITRQVK